MLAKNILIDPVESAHEKVMLPDVADRKRMPVGLSDLGRARRLAFFLHPDKARSIELTAAALGKVEGVADKQLRRGAYRPRKGRTKVFLSSVQILQGLIYCESEPLERSQEISGGKRASLLGAEDLLVRYIKHLVQISLWRNSFYVTLALCKFLYRYSTAEVMAIYDLVSQDSECRLNDCYCRSCKRILLSEIESRFGALISHCRGPRGEKQFVGDEASRSEIDLVRDCLVQFTPWDTACRAPERRELLQPQDLHSPAEGVGHGSAIEVHRIHSLIHPVCFSRLTRTLGLDPPEQRLVIPRFSLRRVARGSRNSRPFAQ